MFNTPKRSKPNTDYSSPEELISEFRKLYDECKQLKITTQNVDLVYSSLRKNFENTWSSSDEKMVIAFFGGSGLHKSSSINFLLCGDFELPLPNSDTSGRGITKTPIRCEYHKEGHDNFILKLFTTDRLESEKKLIYEKLKDCINQANDCDRYDEILLQVPIKFKPSQSLFPDNVQFLDLIGTEVNMNAKSIQEESPSVKKNRDSIRKNEVHCVFIFNKERGKCTTEIIRHLWDIDVFSNLKDKCKPKLVMFDIVQAWRKTEQEIESNFKAEGLDQCTKSLQVSLQQAFDFDLDPNAEKTTENSKLELPLMHKPVIIPELSKNCTTCFLLVRSTQISDNSSQVLNEVVRSIAQMIQNNKKHLIFESAAKILVEIRQKLKCKLSSQTNDMTSALLKFFASKQYAKLKLESADQIDAIVHTTQDYFLHRDIMEPITELNDDADISYYKWSSYEAIEFRINEIYEDKFIMDLVSYFMDYKKRLDETIRKYLINAKKADLQFYFFFDFNAEYFAWRIENVLKNTLRNELSKFIHEKMKSGSAQEEEIMSHFSTARHKIEQALDMKECIVDSSTENSSTVNLSTLEDKLKHLDDKIRAQLSDLAANDTLSIHEFYEIREPCLHFSQRTLKFPTSNSPCDSLENCSQQKWIQVTKSDSKASDLFAEGRKKSQIIENKQFFHKEITDEFKSEIEELGIDTAIQIQIDRIDEKVIFEYDSVKINKKINSVLKNLDDLDSDGLATHLYPIFISSVQRDSNFIPNLLVDDLCRPDSSIKKFIIFLFVEAGPPTQRFDQTIKFYVNLTNSLLEKNSDKLAENAIVLCFLPEQNLGIGRKRKLMMLFAEWMNLKRFYLCDDDIEQFYIYDPRPQFRRCRDHHLAASKALAYMSHVMDCGLEDKDIDSSKPKDPLTSKQICSFIKKLPLPGNNTEELLESIENIFVDKKYVTQKDYLFFLLNKLGEEGKKIEKELKDLLLSDKAKVLGQIGLWNQNASSMRTTFTSRLQGNNRTTHAISKIRYQVVLYNMHAINGIHPISDNALFEMALTKEDRDKLCAKIENKNFDNKEACRAARLGYRYSDKAHVYYQILNRVTGYLVYYFSFKSMRNIPSLVNGKKNQ